MTTVMLIANPIKTTSSKEVKVGEGEGKDASAQNVNFQIAFHYMLCYNCVYLYLYCTVYNIHCTYIIYTVWIMIDVY